MTHVEKDEDKHMHEVCEHFPELKRMIYCYGQMLGAKDFMDEQQYFRSKIALLNRCLHGYGVVCGLEVRPHKSVEYEGQGEAEQYEPPKNDADEKDRYPIWLQVSCGMAINAQGRELVVRQPICVNLWDVLTEEDANWAQEQKDGFSFDVTLCYAQHKSNRQRLEVTDDCLDGPQPRHIYTRWHEVPCVRLTRNAPPDQTCDPCCNPIDESCVWLARVSIRESLPPQIEIDNTLRRLIGVYQPTTITGINWFHGATYSESLAGCLLKDGLEFTFSGPIAKDSIPHDNAIVDVLGVDGSGIGQGQVLAFPTITDVQSGNRRIKVKVPQYQLNNKDRVHIVLRCDFILDHCCRPVDGNHVGGLVPYCDWDPTDDTYEKEFAYIQTEQAKRPIPKHCREEVGVVRPPMSGNGTPGGTFESWIFIQSDDECRKKLGS